MKLNRFYSKPISLFFGICIYFLIGLNILSTGCQKAPEVVPTQQDKPTDQTLVSSDLIGEYSAEEINQRFKDRPEIKLFTRFGIKAYKIVYNTTDVNGKAIQASGALLIPMVNAPLAVVSQQHGTITNNKAAPSFYNSSSEVWSFGTVLASTGYIVSAPDYIGYGVASQLPHPYEHANSLASASLDMLRASKEFCIKQKIALNDQLFLAGYSEGGYATMALHKLIEEKHSAEFTVTASAPGGGAYDKTAFAKTILQTNKPLSFISNYLWVLQTYNQVYGLNKPFNYYLKEPYASNVQKNGISAEVEKNPKKLFTPTFTQGILEGTDTALLNAMKDNDIYNWKPKAPVKLFHGTADDFVPFFNSQHAYEAMHKNGATQVELRKIEGGDHFTSIAVYTLEMFMYFNSFNQQSY